MAIDFLSAFSSAYRLLLYYSRCVSRKSHSALFTFTHLGDSMFENKKIVVLGGAAGGALITGMLDTGIKLRSQFIVNSGSRQARTDSARLGIETTLSNGEAVRVAACALW